MFEKSVIIELAGSISGIKGPMNSMSTNNTFAIYENLSTAMNEKIYETKEGKTRPFLSLFNSLNLTYALLFIGNAIAYKIML